MLRRLFLTLAFLGGGAFTTAQDVGTKIDEVNITGLAQTGAKSWEDFGGRAVLLEFFAEW